MTKADIDPHIDRVFEAFDSQDADRAIAQFANDGVFVETADDRTFSKDAFRTYLAERVFVGFPDYTVVERDVLTTHDWATVIEYRFQGTHSGQLGESQPTGKTITLPIVAVITVSDEGITEWRDYLNSERLRDQLNEKR